MVNRQEASSSSMPVAPDTEICAREAFGLDVDMAIPAFREPSSSTPKRDPEYCFDQDTTLAIVAGFCHNRRVIVQGYHGTGKSTHIEQVAARLNWPCVRVNLDSHISRIDLIGKDAIVTHEGKQITQFQDGILPWALRNPVALVFDEYDAGRADIMFVIQRILEADGHLTLLDQNEVIKPNKYFRLFATTNTIGLGDSSGLYHGTQQINQGQMDRWNMVVTLNYLAPEKEREIILSKCPAYNTPEGKETIRKMIEVAHGTREGFKNDTLSTVMSPRTVLTWAQNAEIFNNNWGYSFRVTFLNKCDEEERKTISEIYHKSFDEELAESVIHHARAE